MVLLVLMRPDYRVNVDKLCSEFSIVAQTMQTITMMGCQTSRSTALPCNMTNGPRKIE